MGAGFRRCVIAAALVLFRLLQIVGAAEDDDSLCWDRWEGDRVTYTWSMTSGKALEFKTAIDRYSYDPNIHTVALRLNWSDVDGTFSDWLIFDYQDGKLYTIKNGTCQTSGLSEPFENECIPEQSSYIYTSTFLGYAGNDGAEPGDGVFINEANFTLPSGTAFQITAPPYPVTRQVYSSIPSNGLLLKEMIFQNPEEVADSHVFLPPDYCK